MSAHSEPGVRFRRDGSVRLALLVLAVLAAATGAVYGRGQRSAEDPAEPAAAFAQPTAEASARFAGLVVDAAGMPIADVYVAMCASACWPARTDADGRFLYEELPVEQYALDVRGETVTERALTSVVFPVKLEAGDQDLGAPIQLQEAVSVPAWDGVGPARFAGLSLIPSAPVDLSMLDRAGGGAIGGAQVPPSGWPSYRLAVDQVPYRPLAMWALRPFGARAGQLLEVRAAIPGQDLESGTEMAFFSVDPVTGAAEWLGPAVPVGDEVGTAAGNGIETLTWIILATPQR